MGLTASKTPEEELKQFFKREIKGSDSCTFSGSLMTYNSSVFKNFEAWLRMNKYTFEASENYVEGTFTYTISKIK